MARPLQPGAHNVWEGGANGKDPNFPVLATCKKNRNSPILSLGLAEKSNEYEILSFLGGRAKYWLRQQMGSAKKTVTDISECLSYSTISHFSFHNMYV